MQLVLLQVEGHCVIREGAGSSSGIFENLSTAPALMGSRQPKEGKADAPGQLPPGNQRRRT